MLSKHIRLSRIVIIPSQLDPTAPGAAVINVELPQMIADTDADGGPVEYGVVPQERTVHDAAIIAASRQLVDAIAAHFARELAAPVRLGRREIGPDGTASAIIGAARS
jgi:hypothetical protein